MFLVLSLLFSWFDKYNQLKEHQNKIEKNMKKRKTKNYYQQHGIQHDCRIGVCHRRVTKVFPGQGRISKKRAHYEDETTRIYGTTSFIKTSFRISV